MIIDELYLIGKNHMYLIKQRLCHDSREICETFGGFCLILVGNLQQLPQLVIEVFLK